MFLKCKKLILKQNSSIKCNGQNGHGGKFDGGGNGSGGSILIICNELEIDKDATIECIGGNRGNKYGEGGDGRIRIDIINKSSLKFIEQIIPKPYFG